MRDYRVRSFKKVVSRKGKKKKKGKKRKKKQLGLTMI